MIIKLFLFLSVFAASAKAQIPIEGALNLTLAAEQLNMTVEEVSVLFQVDVENAQIDGGASTDMSFEEAMAKIDGLCFPGTCECDICGDGKVLGDPLGSIDLLGFSFPCAALEILDQIDSLGSAACFAAKLAVKNFLRPQCGGCVDQVIDTCAACGPPEDFLLSPDDTIIGPLTCGVLDDFLMKKQIDTRVCGGIQGVIDKFEVCDCVESPSSAPSAMPSESAAPSDIPSASPSESFAPTMSMQKSWR